MALKPSYGNTSGSSNTATGYQALFNSVTAARSTAVGFQALHQQAGGNGDTTAIGYRALFNNTTGGRNDAVGSGALGTNTTGSDNTAIGDLAGSSLTTGSGNVCVGAGVGGVADESDTTRIRNIGNTSQNTGVMLTLDAVGGTKLGYVVVASSRRYKEEIKPMAANQAKRFIRSILLISATNRTSIRTPAHSTSAWSPRK